jgi:hypothetical protein
MFGAKLLLKQTLNPGWFGHPATITIYLLAATDAIVYACGWLAGAWADPAAFGRAVYTNPALIIVPSRLTALIPGVISVAITYRIGRRLLSVEAGLIAALILALSPLHIELSQVIRTDVQMTMFFLLAVNAALPLVKGFDGRALAWSCFFTGLAGVTKWPGLLALSVPIALMLKHHAPFKVQLARLFAAGAGTILTVIVASPYLVLDFRTFLNSVLLEGRPKHLSQTGSGFLPNVDLYLLQVIPYALTIAGAALAAIGLVLALREKSPLRRTIVLPFVLLLGLVGVQHIFWARWAIPFIPFLAILAAFALVRLASWISTRSGAGLGATTTALAMILGGTLGVSALASARERSNDTRDEAVRWLFANAPQNASIAAETPAIILIKGKWPLLYPLGDLGCVDPRKAMDDHVDYGDVQSATKGRININLGTIAPARVDSCKADFMMINELDRYLAESKDYPNEVATYRKLLAGTRQVAVFRPRPGQAGGSMVRIFRRTAVNHP